MISTRTYLGGFIEIKCDELDTTLYSKSQAKDFKNELLGVIEDLDYFIEKADDE